MGKVTIKKISCIITAALLGNFSIEGAYRNRPASPRPGGRLESAQESKQAFIQAWDRKSEIEKVRFGLEVLIKQEAETCKELELILSEHQEHLKELRDGLSSLKAGIPLDPKMQSSVLRHMNAIIMQSRSEKEQQRIVALQANEARKKEAAWSEAYEKRKMVSPKNLTSPTPFSPMRSESTLSEKIALIQEFESPRATLAPGHIPGTKSVQPKTPKATPTTAATFERPESA